MLDSMRPIELLEDAPLVNRVRPASHSKSTLCHSTPKHLVSSNVDIE